MVSETPSSIAAREGFGKMVDGLLNEQAKSAGQNFNKTVDAAVLLSGVDLTALQKVAYTGKEQVPALNNEDMVRAPSGPSLIV